MPNLCTSKVIRIQPQKDWPVWKTDYNIAHCQLPVHVDGCGFVPNLCVSKLSDSTPCGGTRSWPIKAVGSAPDLIYTMPFHEIFPYGTTVVV